MGERERATAPLPLFEWIVWSTFVSTPTKSSRERITDTFRSICECESTACTREWGAEEDGSGGSGGGGGDRACSVFPLSEWWALSFVTPSSSERSSG